MTTHFDPATAAVAARAAELTQVVHRLHARGLASGTGGNFSVALAPDIAGRGRLLMTPSGVDKGLVTAADLVVVDEAGRLVTGFGKPSAETALHLVILRDRNAGAVLHVHSVWNTLLSERFAEAGELLITGLEMLKGLAGVTTHEHHEHVPVLANSQDMPRLASEIGRALSARPGCHGVLIAGHGLYTWGADLAEAHRHVEIFEFLFEVVARPLFGR